MFNLESSVNGTPILQTLLLNILDHQVLYMENKFSSIDSSVGKAH